MLEVSVFATGGGPDGDEIAVPIVNSGETDVDGLELRLAISVDQVITANDHAAYSENLVLAAGDELNLTVGMGDVDASVGDGLYYLGVILDPEGEQIQGTPPAVASQGLWEVFGNHLIYTAADAYEDDDDTSTTEAFTLGAARSHTLTPLDADYVSFDPAAGEFYRATVSDATVDVTLAVVYVDESAVFNGTATPVEDLDPSDGTSIDFYAEQEPMFYAKVEAQNAAQQGSYTILLERIAPPNTTAATFGGANFDVNGVSSCEMRYFDMVMPGTAVMIDGTSVGGTTVSVYVLDTSATQIHAEVGGGNSVSFDPGGLPSGVHYIGIRETSDCASSLTLRISASDGA